LETDRTSVLELKDCVVVAKSAVFHSHHSLCKVVTKISTVKPLRTAETQFLWGEFCPFKIFFWQKALKSASIAFEEVTIMTT